MDYAQDYASIAFCAFSPSSFSSFPYHRRAVFPSYASFRHVYRPAAHSLIDPVPRYYRTCVFYPFSYAFV